MLLSLRASVLQAKQSSTTTRIQFRIGIQFDLSCLKEIEVANLTKRDKLNVIVIASQCSPGEAIFHNQ
jgi:hypothetical protein